MQRATFGLRLSWGMIGANIFFPDMLAQSSSIFAVFTRFIHESLLYLLYFRFVEQGC